MIEELNDQDEATHVNTNETEEEAQGECPAFDDNLEFVADCKGNLTDLRRILHLSLAKGNPK
jgi:hypothetical protein